MPVLSGSPFRREPIGAVRVGTSRVLLELVIRAFQDGQTPEAIVESYETLKEAIDTRKEKSGRTRTTR